MTDEPSERMVMVYVLTLLASTLGLLVTLGLLIASVVWTPFTTDIGPMIVGLAVAVGIPSGLAGCWAMSR